jgi:hypothetical protein
MYSLIPCFFSIILLPSCKDYAKTYSISDVYQLDSVAANDINNAKNVHITGNTYFYLGKDTFAILSLVDLVRLQANSSIYIGNNLFVDSLMSSDSIYSRKGASMGGGINLGNNPLKNANLDNVYIKNDQWLYGRDYVGNPIPLFKIDQDNNVTFGPTVALSSLFICPDTKATIVNIPILRANYGEIVGFSFMVGGSFLLQSKSIADGAGGTIDEYVQIKDLIVEDEFFHRDSINCDTVFNQVTSSKDMLEYIWLSTKHDSVSLSIRSIDPPVSFVEDIMLYPGKDTLLGVFKFLRSRDGLSFRIKADSTIGWRHAQIEVRFVSKRIIK